MNRQVYKLMQGTWWRHRCALDGSFNLRDCIQRVYSIVQQQVARAVAARVTHYYTDATCTRADYTRAACEATESLRAGLQAASAREDWEALLEGVQFVCLMLGRVAKGMACTLAAAARTQAVALTSAVGKGEHPTSVSVAVLPELTQSL